MLKEVLRTMRSIVWRDVVIVSFEKKLSYHPLLWPRHCGQWIKHKLNMPKPGVSLQAAPSSSLLGWCLGGVRDLVQAVEQMGDVT
jgi:hypothetical protein